MSQILYRTSVYKNVFFYLKFKFNSASCFLFAKYGNLMTPKQPLRETERVFGMTDFMDKETGVLLACGFPHVTCLKRFRAEKRSRFSYF